MAYLSTDPPLTPQRKRTLALFIAVIVVTAAVLCFTFALDFDNAKPLAWIPWWALALLFYLFERYSVYLEAAGQGSGHALVELPIVIGLAALGPEMLIVARLAGSLANRAVQMRTAPFRLAFNVALTWFEISFVLAVLALLPTSLDVTAWQWWLPIVAVLLLTDVICATLVAGAIAIATGEKSTSFRPAVQLADSTAVAVSAVAAIMMALAFNVYPVSAVLGVVLSMLLVIAYSHHRQTVARYGSLRELMRQMDASMAGIGGSGWHTVLQQMVAGFNARHAEIVIFPADRDGDVRRYWLGPGGVKVDDGSMTEVGAVQRYRALARRHKVTYVDTKDFPHQFDVAPDSGACMAAPLIIHGKPAGLLLLAGKSVGERAFGSLQLDQFAIFAERMGLALEQDRLLHRVQEEAADLRKKMYVDMQTGLPSESAFHEAMHRNSGESATVVLITAANITEVNRKIGRDAGNQVLTELATRLKRAISNDAQLFRHRGSRYILRIPRLAQGVAEEAVHDWLKSASSTYDVEGKKLYIDVHAGIAHYPDDADAPDALLEIANLAAEEAKSAHLPVITYRVPPDANDVLGLTLKGDLADAIRNGDIELFFQPRIRLHDASLVGAEALARWHHSEKGYVRPDTFIRIAEETGLIPELSRLVLRKAVKQAVAWHGAGYALTVSVNLSAHDLRDRNICTVVRSLLQEFSLAPRFLVVEITETMLMENIDEAVEIVEELHGIGVAISIDDFGTGYSSFAYLARLPLDEIKIDRSFVSHMDVRSADATVVETLIELGHKLQMTVVAEGIESGAIMSRLAALGCDQAQGFFIARPMDAKTFATFLEQHPKSLFEQG